MAEFKKKQRISDGKLHLMITAAITFEFLQTMFWLVFFMLGLIPFIGMGFGAVGFIFSSIMAVFGYFSFWMWFKFADVHMTDFMTPDVLVWFFGTAVLEMTFFGILPLFTLGVIRTAYLVRARDEEYNKKHAPKSIELPPNRARRQQRLLDARLRNDASASGSPVSSDRRTFSKTNPELARRIPASQG